MSDPAQTRPLGAQISHMLKSRGVDTIFGIPGVHNQEMYRGIEEAGIRHILARHEQGAGFMADGYARASGRPGVAYVITGPGLCNVMTPMGQAYSDSAPVLVLSSCLNETAATRGQLHQMLDQEVAAGTVCDWSETAQTPDAAYALIDRALAEFQTKRPRSKHIQVPIPLLEGEAKPAPAAAPAISIAHSAQIPAHIAAMITAAKRPFFVLGGGAVHASEPARAALTALGAASFSTYAGRGIISPDDPLHYGAYLGRPESADVAASADLVVVVGSELAEVDLWRTDLGHTAPMIRVDIDPEVLAQMHGSEALLMDSFGFFTQLNAALADHTAKTSWKPQPVKQARARWRAEADAERPGIVPVVDALREVMPEDAMIYSDMTQFAYTGKEVWDMERPGHWHHPYGFGTLGYALPAGIGGAAARPGLPTCVIAGDYGFQYTVQELGTAVELGQPLPILLWDNGKLKEIEDSMVRAQIAPNSVMAHNPDFVALAKAYGAYAEAPKSFSELKKAVTEAFAADGPTLIYMTADMTQD
ncbi:acetolactate synthase isozyme1 large subunit [Roseovarius sp. LXJ103]|uniref:thiamine pyrophosphate-binding protein n=1 Tax=Roseovarius carneus TaxID=2853164 RepID=UPI000D60BD22|nr:thiamine pyrophosphate-binding protein [Roseovarius carneus]MBZ8117831.1 acetolactate synthase isozyme1 large subunit [Roseovarius carneus]PWE36405.1 acetolactate synthase isozyme1 large subunit [Pelagicola sp. LXJ1103]